MQINKFKVNGNIMALYVFQFSLLQPVASLVNSQLPVAIFTLVLILIMLLNNNYKIKKYVVYSFVLFTIYFLLNALIFEQSLPIVLSTYFDFALKSFSAIIIGSLTIKSDDIFDIFLKVAVLNFTLIALFPFVKFLDSMNYMRFGYAMIPSALMFWMEGARKRGIAQLSWIGLAIISSFLTVIYGSRGSVVVFLLFILLLFLFNKKLTIGKRLTVVLFSCGIMYMAFQNNLLIKLANFVNYNLGINSYALEKFQMMLNTGLLESSSGRDMIYSSIWAYFRLNPLTGYGIGFTELNLGLTAHNLILQILIESGILGLIIWIVVWGYCLFCYKQISRRPIEGLFLVTTLMISISFGRLLVSSDLWLRPEYWFTLSLILNFGYKNENAVAFDSKVGRYFIKSS